MLGKDIQKARRLSAAQELVKPMRASLSTASLKNETADAPSSNSPKKITDESSGSSSDAADADADAVAAALADVKGELDALHSADNVPVATPPKEGRALAEAEAKEGLEDDGERARREPVSLDYDELASMLQNSHSPVPVPVPSTISSSRVKAESAGLQGAPETCQKKRGATLYTQTITLGLGVVRYLYLKDFLETLDWADKISISTT